MLNNLVDSAVELLRAIVKIPSYSGEEQEVCTFISQLLSSRKIDFEVVGNNIIAKSTGWSEGRPVLMLNSHLDTVVPSESYSFNPFDPSNDYNIVRGVGSNDAGASLASMLTVFLAYSNYFDPSKRPPFNLLLLLSAQEEVSGSEGISLALTKSPVIDAAIIGEPTGMRTAIAERGLLVLDCICRGVAGHAAREEGVNALYKAVEDIALLKDFTFDKISPTMGKVKLTVTQISAGKQHNVVPDSCSFVVDIRPTELYSNSEIVELLSSHLQSEIRPRNLKNRSSSTPLGNPLIEAAKKCGFELFVSPTTSDWMRIKTPAIKMGPGDSSRSHTPDEYVTRSEIENGVAGYIKFIDNLKLL